MTTEINKSIVDKIRKLHNLANRAGSEAEAANAAQRVAELLAKHNLDMGILQEDEPKATSQEYEEPTEKLQPYDITMAHAVKEMMDVELYITLKPRIKTIETRNRFGRVIRTTQRKYARSIVFLGLPSNVEAAVMMMKYFQESNVAMLDARWHAGQIKGLTECRSFRIGCADTILQKCRQAKQDMMARLEGNTECTAVIFVGQAVAKKALDAMNLKGSHHANNHVGDTMAYMMGRQDGGRIDIHGSRTNRMLKG